MTIARKPKSKSRSTNAAIDAVISRGGGVARSSKKKPDKTAVVIRIPATILQQLDSALKTQPIKKPRHTWILEAIVEKLERESN